MSKQYRKGNKGKDQYSRESKGNKQYIPRGSMRYDDIHTNDISWWNKATGIYPAVANVPFNKIHGGSYPVSAPIGVYGETVFEDDAPLHSFPSVMRITYTPGIGVCSTLTDAVNRAMQAMFSAIYSKTTGVLEFPPYALGLYCIAVMSIAQNIALCKRALGLSNHYYATNVNYPRLLISASGVDPDSVIEHQNDVAVKINTRIARFNTLKVPAYMDIFKRHYALCNNVWADADTTAAQLFMFKPDIYYVYSDIGDPTFRDGLATVYPVKFAEEEGEPSIDYYLDIIDRQINMVMNSHDFVRITGSLQRAFPDSSFLTIDMIDQNYRVEISKDETMLYQIHNSYAVGEAFTTQITIPYFGSATVCKHNWITGDPEKNVIAYNPVLKLEKDTDPDAVLTAGVFTGDGTIMNTFDAGKVGPDWIMESSRLMSTWEVEPGGTYKCASALGTEFINHYTIYTPEDNGASKSVINVPTYLYNRWNSDGEQINWVDTHMLDRWTKFHFVPQLYIANIEDSISGKPMLTHIGFVGDVQTWTTIGKDDLRGLHDAALLSAFNTDGAIALK